VLCVHKQSAASVTAISLSPGYGVLAAACVGRTRSSLWPRRRVRYRLHESPVVNYQELVRAQAMWQRVPEGVAERVVAGDLVPNGCVLVRAAVVTVQ
jgi:hypothetical protein